MNLTGMANQSLAQKYGSRLAALNGNGAVQRSAQGVRSAEGTREALLEVSKEFESIFVYQMISAMRKTVQESTLIKKSNGEKIFEGMLDEEWARKLVSQNGGGLSDSIYRQLSRQMGFDEVDSAPAVRAGSGAAYGGPSVSPLLLMPTADPALVPVSRAVTD